MLPVDPIKKTVIPKYIHIWLAVEDDDGQVLMLLMMLMLLMLMLLLFELIRVEFVRLLPDILL